MSNHEDQDQTPPKDGVRLSLKVSNELNDMLDSMATRGATNKSEILRRALALMEVAQEAKTKGKRLGIANSDGGLETELIVF